MSETNPLIDDRFVTLLLELQGLDELLALPAFAEHDREGLMLFLSEAGRLAREKLFPLFRAMDIEQPVFEEGRVRVHPKMKELWPQMVELGVTSATRPEEVGGASLPLTVASLAYAYLMAGNGAAAGFPGLTGGAGHLIEAFGSEALKERFMRPMYEGRWAGTMALTEPHAGSSLGDLLTTATPIEGGEPGRYLVRGSKIFISGGDQDITENIVHLTLATIEGGGISLFAIPKLRPELRGDKVELVPNDVAVAGVIHKIGWRGLPSLALNFGERDDCVGWLVGPPGRGLRQMFQMMNEARILVGLNAAATASAAYHESRLYALTRRQGRALGVRGQEGEQVPIVEHPDVRRMLLRQKSIVEGSFALVIAAARYADLSEHAKSEEERNRAKMLLDLLTPVAKTFPAEWGFESTALSVQIHGGYGYTSEYLPEAWMRDQKLNTLHEGTTGIQSLDLLGRKVVAGGGATLRVFLDEVGRDLKEAEGLVDEDLLQHFRADLDRMTGLTAVLGGRGLSGDLLGMLGHSVDYLYAFSILVVGWQHLRLWTLAAKKREAEEGDQARLEGSVAAARYWLATEMPRVSHLADLCEAGESSYLDLRAEHF